MVHYVIIDSFTPAGGLQHITHKETAIVNDAYVGPKVHTYIPGPLTQVRFKTDVKS